MTHIGPHPLGGSIDYYKGDWVAFAATTELKAQDYKVGPCPTGTIKIWISTELKDRE